MPTSPSHPRRTSRFASALLVLCTLVAAAPEPEEDPDLDQRIDPDQDVVTGVAELTEGHIDVGPRFVDDEWQLMVHDDLSYDDEAADSVWRFADETVFRIGDNALLAVPDDDAYEFLGVDGGREVHVIPQTQDPDVVWLGWNTQDPEVMDTIDRGVTLSLVGTEGPGHLVVYLQSGAFEEPDILWDSRIDDTQPAWIPVNTHTHANWVFTEPGVHLVHLEVAAELIDGTTVTDTRSLRFAVGDEVDVDDALAGEPEVAAPDGVGGADGAADGVDDATADNATVAAGDERAGDRDGISITVIVGALALLLVASGVWLTIRARRARTRAFAERDASGGGADRGSA